MTIKSKNHQCLENHIKNKCFRALTQKRNILCITKPFQKQGHELNTNLTVLYTTTILTWLYRKKDSNTNCWWAHISFVLQSRKGVNIVVEIKHFAEATQRYGFHMQRSCLTIFDNIDPRANELTNSSSKSTLSLITSRENKKANTLCKKSLSVWVLSWLVPKWFDELTNHIGVTKPRFFFFILHFTTCWKWKTKGFKIVTSSKR